MKSVVFVSIVRFLSSEQCQRRGQLRPGFPAALAAAVVPQLRGQDITAHMGSQSSTGRRIRPELSIRRPLEWGRQLRGRSLCKTDYRLRPRRSPVLVQCDPELGRPVHP
jgi:hypothetical protein